LGPGLITGASDDDPGGIATYALAGATLGYSTLWTAVIALPLMTAVELTCARIGLISGTRLTGALKGHCPRSLMLAANNRDIMGEQTNGFWLNMFGWATVVVMGVAALAFLLRPG
jgi:Mn2+/Fe2+ NRAMP family transporter